MKRVMCSQHLNNLSRQEVQIWAVITLTRLLHGKLNETDAYYFNLSLKDDQFSILEYFSVSRIRILTNNDTRIQAVKYQ
jgi:hypothetical protein